MTFYQATLSQGFFRRDTPAHRNHLLPREKRRSWGSRRKDTACLAFPLILWQTCMWASLMTRCLIHLTKPPEEISKDTNSVPAFDCSPLYCSSVLDYFCHTGNMLTDCWAWYWTLFIFYLSWIICHLIYFHIQREPISSHFLIMYCLFLHPFSFYHRSSWAQMPDI